MTGASAPGVTVAELAAASELPPHEAARLMKVALGEVGRPGVPPPHQVVDVAGAAAFKGLAAERRRGVPLQYLEGSAAFGPIEVAVDERVLIPRPETEQLWELIVRRLAGSDPGVIVDLCTGSGVLALALKHRFPAADVYATDVSPEALDLAASNGEVAGARRDVAPGRSVFAASGRVAGTGRCAGGEPSLRRGSRSGGAPDRRAGARAPGGTRGRRDR